ncbi:hypothetical protein CLAFUW4_08182 [Fulvia fulva]|uniref:Uncharacterized protein n=1 Tax=Passalora fulva TaxID=5499 RepID=A0A9Q8P698_PASFU|nr:uncharacterized protein CLAFUR5_08295 [Fulvia fulva]KAK4629162.1 hypothetical protein CLAFUR4_08187 [Fulvia fulva]KAK4629822.1 hypothetical protein CLAFUR0_08182 [Fulvia fulva]UJO14940.1 hypothetical protein CLAFUR5_08295 [Fulvia fulva]WPV12062.1 hypothetical protein CLAFUW4_08182 [Fulvia fulva]WPV27672.1 hypothetical protein CLAFUW7_08182 [Fulvia fulva]
MKTTSNTAHTVFPFFDLPLELRDMIYDETLEDRQDQRLCNSVYLKAKGVPRTNILLVSKDVKQEYEQRATKHSHLTVKDLRSYDEVRTALPAAAKKVSHIVIEPCVCTSELAKYLAKFTPLIGLVTSPFFSLKTLTINIVMIAGDRLETLETAQQWVNELVE